MIFIIGYYVSWLVRRYHDFAYRYRHHIQLEPIVWYAGRNKGTLVVTGKPDFTRPLKWTRYEQLGGQFKFIETEVQKG